MLVGVLRSARVIKVGCIFKSSGSFLSNAHKNAIIVKPWSKSESKPLSQQAPKSNKTPPKIRKKKDLDLGLTLKSHGKKVMNHPLVLEG